MSGNAVRLQAINNVEGYVPPAKSFDPNEAPGEIFGANVFTLAEMRLRLHKWRSMGIRIVKWTVIAGLGFFAVLLLERMAMVL